MVSSNTLLKISYVQQSRLFQGFSLIGLKQEPLNLLAEQEINKCYLETKAVTLEHWSLLFSVCSAECYCN